MVITAYGVCCFLTWYVVCFDMVYELVALPIFLACDAAAPAHAVI